MTFLNDARAAKAQRHGQLLRRLGGIVEPAPEPEREETKTPPFDGGARKTPERAITHEQTLSALIASRTGHVAEFES